MQNEMHSQNIESVEAAIALRELTSSSEFAELADECGYNRKLRLHVRLPRRASCLTRRAMVAALREAELERWQANGGDYLRSIQHLA